MGSLNTEAEGKETPAPTGNIADPVVIVFREGTQIEGRKPGVPYVVDGALAHHYTQVLGVADLREASPSRPQDRAMKAPPRGRNGREE